MSQQRCLLIFLEGEPESPVATIPTNITTTTSRLDLVLISKPEIMFLELTVPSNSPEALAAARSRKANKASYLELMADLEESGDRISWPFRYEGPQNSVERIPSI